MSDLVKYLKVSLLSTTMMLSGCASLEAITKTNEGDACNPAVSAVLGAMLGAAASGGDRNSLAKGALIGGVAGGALCLAINATTRQVRPAAEVETEFKRKSGGKLPIKTQVIAYNSAFEPSRPVKSGELVKVESNLSVVSGTSQPLTSLREDLVLSDALGKELKRTSKNIHSYQPNGVSTAASSGAFSNSFTFRFPANVSQGLYAYRTELYVNGQKTSEGRGKIQLVMGKSSAIHVAIL